MRKKLLCLVLAAAMTVASVAPVQALKYSGTAAYESGKYYQALKRVALTGDQRTDMVNVALSQVGYQEGGSSPQLSGEVYGGVNFTEFGAWYEMQDMWCAMFVSWCAYVCGISTDIVPKHSYTPNGLKWFRNRGLAHEHSEIVAGEYIPQPGDLIYFRSSRNKNTTNHVGMVVGFSNGMIYTVEGNIGSVYEYSNGGTVTNVAYPITNEYIVAVCSPNYLDTGFNGADALERLCQVVREAEGGGYDTVTVAGEDLRLGIGQWQGEQARDLLNQIRMADEAAFSRLDTAGISAALDDGVWNGFSADQIRCVRWILGTEAGIRAQDGLLSRQLRSHLGSARALGLTDEKTQSMFALVCQLGGSAAGVRIVSALEPEAAGADFLEALAQSAYSHLVPMAQKL